MASSIPGSKTAYIKSKPVDFPCPTRLKRHLNTVVEDLRTVRARAGINIRLRQTPDATEFNADIDKADKFRPREIPFQVVTVRNPSLGYRAIGVISDSHLFNSEDRDTYEEDNADWGLLDDDETGSEGPIPVDSLNLGDKIWLQIELSPDDQSITSIDVAFGTVGAGQWDTFPNPIEINDDDPSNVYQQFYHQAIAEITDPSVDPRPGFSVFRTDGTELQVTQLLFYDLMMTTAHTDRDAKYPDVPLLVAVPWTLNPATALDGSADEINTVPPPSSGDDPMTPWQFGTADTDETPFQVVPTPQNGVNAIGVISNSHLFNSEDRDTYEEDNSAWGLLSDDQTTGFFDVPALGGKIWLKVTLDPTDQSITSIDVESGAAWDRYPDPVFINASDPENPYQEFFYQIIAEVTDPTQDPRPGFQIGDVQVTQLLFSDLMMTTATTTLDADEPGLPLLVAIPWTVLPGTDTSGNADEIPSESDLMTPWQLGSQETLNDYNFELFDASEPGLAKVLILDGVVIGPNDDPVDPDGMPSNDTFTLSVNDGDEIWVEVDWDLETDDGVSGDNITGASINSGPITPDDDGLTQYITIGSVGVDDSGDVPIVTGRNEVCGDIVIQYPPSLTSDELLQLSVDIDTGNVVWKTSKIAQVTTEDDSSYTGGGVTGLDQIDVLTFDNHGFELYDGGGGQAVVKNKAGLLEVTTEDDSSYTGGGVTDLTDRDVLTFDNHAFELYDGGGGQAVIKSKVGLLEVTTEDDSGYTGGGVTDLTDREILTFDNHGFELYDGGGGQAVIKAKGGLLEVTTEDDSGYTGGGVTDLTDREILTFDNHSFELYDGGGGQAVIKSIGGHFEVTTEDDSGYTGGGVTDLTDRDILTFDNNSFAIYDGGGGQAVIKFIDLLDVTAEDASAFTGSGSTDLPERDVLTFDSNSFVIYDGGGGQAIVKSLQGGISVTGDSGFVDDVSDITFTIAPDPSAGFINVIDGGGGSAIVEIPVIPVSVGGFNVLVDNDGATYWGGTQTCDCTTIVDGGGP